MINKPQGFRSNPGAGYTQSKILLNPLRGKPRELGAVSQTLDASI